MKVVLLLACFLYSANAGITTGTAKWIPNDGQTGETLEQQQQKSPHKLLTLSEAKKMICGKNGWRSNENKTSEDASFHEMGGPITYDKTNIDLHLTNAKEYYGTKIDVDCETEVVNKTAFSIDAYVIMNDHWEEYDFGFNGTVLGRSVDEKGKVKLAWERVELQFEAEVDPSSPDFQNVSLEVHCRSPTLTFRGIPVTNKIEQERLYTAIYDMVERSWGKSLANYGDSNKVKNFISCRQKAPTAKVV